MDGYLSWDEKTITDFSEQNISALYERGFVFTRIDKGVMTQTRSVRIDLNKFELTSENKRVLRKVENLDLNIVPLPHQNYDWRVHKLGVDFYTKKFGEKIFSANKIKELITEKTSNYNRLFEYAAGGETIGYCIVYETSDLMHYAYPFYNLDTQINNLGMGMMTKAIVWAKENNKKYVCLGSARDTAALYKTQFKGFEWFDGEKWRDDIEELKKIL